MKITEFFMRRPTLFWSLMAGIIVAGIICFIQMPKLKTPSWQPSRPWWLWYIREPAPTRWN